MKKINDILDQARKGSEEYTDTINEYIDSFQSVVLRGAGNFGSALGLLLLEKGIEKDALIYWDRRATELGSVHGIPVLFPFTGELDKERTLVINCIPNGSLSGSVERQKGAGDGYPHYISGMALFEGVMCGLSSDRDFDANVCIETTFCNWCACKRLPSLLQKQCKKEAVNGFTDELIFPLATFVISQKCTLNCTHCGQYINHYREEDKINFSLESINVDIDKVLGAVDSIGYVSIIGGEPFVHPDLDKIIDYILTKSNFGVIGITTNGVCSMSDKLLKKLNNGRTRIIFSDYTAALSENQKKLFAENVKKVSESGISYSVGRPIWSTPASLRKLNLSEEKKVEMKAKCNSKHTCKTIQNGVYYPCSTTAGIGSHHLAEYPSDWVKIDNIESIAELRKKIKEVDDQPFYESCDQCGESGGVLSMSGEQGVDLRYKHIEIAIEK